MTMNILLVTMVIILSITLVIFIIWIYLLKKDMYQLNKNLLKITEIESNKELTTTTTDKDIKALARTINELLEKQKIIVSSSNQANRELRQAITNISHDLRTPLTSAIGYIQMATSDKTATKKKTEYLNVTEVRLKALAELINELFEYVQLMENRTNIEIKKMDITNPLRDVLSAFYQDFVDKEFSVEVDIPSNPIYANCDIDLLKRVFQNLIQNVLIHGTDSFKLIIDNQKIVFQNKVVNIEQLEVEKLFERFYKSDTSRSAKTTGLGLAIAKELIVKMDGKIHGEKEGDWLIITIQLTKEA